MKKSYKIFIIYITLQCALMVGNTCAQVVETNYLQSKNSIKIYDNFEIGATTLSSEILKKYFVNGTITNDDKRNVAKQNSEIQRFGFENVYGVNLTLKPDSLLKRKNNLKFSFIAEQKNMLSALVTDDVFKIVLFGNKLFAGDTNGVNISPSAFDKYKYQKYGLGVAFNFSNDSNFSQLYFGASYINAQQYSDLLTHQSNIKFADSTYIMTGNIDFLFRKTNTNNAYFANNGIGAALDLGFVYVANNTTFTMLANDIGFVKWNKVEQLKVDTSFVFSGYKLDMQRLLHDTLYKISTDSVFNVSNHKSEKKITSGLPYTLRLNTQVKWHDNKFTTVVDFTFKKLIGFTPRVLVLQSYKLKNNFEAGMFVANGGFTKWQYGMVFNLNNSKFYGKLTILNPLSYFINKSLPIAGVNFSLAFCW